MSKLEVVHKEVGGCLISYNIQLACVKKLEVIWPVACSLPRRSLKLIIITHSRWGILFMSGVSFFQDYSRKLYKSEMEGCPYIVKTTLIWSSSSTPESPSRLSLPPPTHLINDCRKILHAIPKVLYGSSKSPESAPKAWSDVESTRWSDDKQIFIDINPYCCRELLGVKDAYH